MVGSRGRPEAGGHRQWALGVWKQIWSRLTMEWVLEAQGAAEFTPGKREGHPGAGKPHRTRRESRQKGRGIRGLRSGDRMRTVRGKRGPAREGLKSLHSLLLQSGDLSQSTLGAGASGGFRGSWMRTVGEIRSGQKESSRDQESDGSRPKPLPNAPQDGQAGKGTVARQPLPFFSTSAERRTQESRRGCMWGSRGPPTPLEA